MANLAAILGGAGALIGAVVAAIALIVNARTTRENLQAQREATRQQLDTQDRQHREALIAQRELLALQRLWDAQLPLFERLAETARDIALFAEVMSSRRVARASRSGFKGGFQSGFESGKQSGALAAALRNPFRVPAAESLTVLEEIERWKRLRDKLQEIEALSLVLAPRQVIESIERLVGATTVLTSDKAINDDSLRTATEAAVQLIEQIRAAIPGNK
jgi:hypothetical protein